MNKNKQRQIIKERMKSLSNKDTKSAIIVKKLRELLVNSHNIAAFYPLAREPDIKDLFDDRFFFPKIIDNDLVFIKAKDFRKGKFQIMEPIDGQIINPEDIDIILVPLLAYDDNCKRLGHGGGYYDRYLKKCTKAKRIGVAFSLQKLSEVVTDDNDERLDLIISEE